MLVLESRWSFGLFVPSLGMSVSATPTCIEALSFNMDMVLLLLSVVRGMFLSSFLTRGGGSFQGLVILIGSPAAVAAVVVEVVVASTVLLVIAVLLMLVEVLGVGLSSLFAWSLGSR